MTNEITAQKITIQKNMGLTQALKSHVLKNNYTMSEGSISASEWDKTIDVLNNINEKRKKAGSKLIFTGGNEKSNWHSNFVVNPNQEIEFTKEEMKELYDAMGVSITEQKSKTKIDKEQSKVDKKRAKEEKKAEKERIKEEKKQAKADLTHDKAAIDVIVPRDTKHRRTVQRKFDKANKILTGIAYDKQNPYIKVDTINDDNKSYTVKTAKIKERYVKVKYDSSEEPIEVEINTDNSKKHYAPDVKYTPDVAYCDTKEKTPGYEVSVTEGFDFDAIKRVIDRIFGRKSL